MSRSLVSLGALAVSSVALVWWSASAHADDSQAPSRVWLVLPECKPGPFEAESFVAVLRVELKADGVDRVELTSSDAKPSSLAKITLEVPSCTATSTEVLVRIDDAATNKVVSRSIDLGEVPSAARPRALALAVAELLRASWAELAMKDAPAPSAPVAPAVRRAVVLRFERPIETAVPLTKPAPVATSTSSSPLSRGTSFSGALEMRLFPGFHGTLTGGRLGTSIPFRRSPMLRLVLDGGAMFGGAQDPLGEIRLGMTSGGLGLALASGSDAAGIEIGPRVEAGMGWGSGRPYDSSTSHDAGYAFVGTASLVATGKARLAGDWWSTLSLALGTTYAGIDLRADGRRASGMGGSMLGIAMGFAVVP